VAIVTGGGRGLGRAMVDGLLQGGHQVVAVDRDRAPLEALAETAMRTGASLLTLAEDLTDPRSVERIEQAVLAKHGRIDVLVNNAGIGQSVIWPDHWVKPLRFWDVKLEQWLRFFEINVHAVLLMSQMVRPHMLAHGWGRIVNVTTSLGSMLRAGFAPYGASKAAAESLTAIMAAELADTGITVNVLTPGGLTNTSANPGSPFDRSQMLQPEIMASPLLWLISDDAGDVTGRRFIAARWDPALPPREAASKAGAPAAWSAEGSRPIEPARIG
jgi:NAD(P)-dependent dehydrogenase (short-subunit alcohol dehydrogenase family)